ncbi:MULTISPECIES: CAAD domain-containing protein [unclassified Anabaena]|uniref:CAAD domain-containing protein n=1 Tax=unclassified Anabaena TaxID=2619674 RepID=UPI00082B14E4|nr:MULTISPECIES: CAAD domain-containing protein [unclassified Anabaena]
METEQQPMESLNTNLPQGTIALPKADNVNVPKLPPATDTSSQWQQIAKQVADLLAKLPAYVGNFYQEYNRPIVTVLLILSVLVTLKVLLALLDAINDIPLLEPIFEVIGLSYSTWFIFRYLLKASNRKELVAEINSVKSQFFG